MRIGSAASGRRLLFLPEHGIGDGACLAGAMERADRNAVVSGAGLEALCAEAARLVMGWETADVPWAYDGVASLWHTAGGAPVMTEFSWRPDLDDAQNMQVLDRMIGLGFELVLTAHRGYTIALFSRGSEEAARCRDRDRRIALLRAAVAAMRRSAVG